MAVRPILLLGNPQLFERSAPVERGELGPLRECFQDLRDTLMDCRQKRGLGCGIAAPQIGVKKRVVYLYTDRGRIMINPVLADLSPEKIELWESCLSFPELLVKVQRHKRCTVRYFDRKWNEHVLDCADDLAELVQHEIDHLDGILAIARAIGSEAFALSRERQRLQGIEL